MSHAATITPEALGSLRDHFGLLTEDHSALRGPAWREFIGGTLKPGESAAHLGVARSSLYQERVSLTREFMRTKMIHIIQVADLAHELFKNDNATKRWILTPNSYFFGKSPLEVCLLGDGPQLIDFLNRKLGRHREAVEEAT